MEQERIQRVGSWVVQENLSTNELFYYPEVINKVNMYTLHNFRMK